MRTVIDLDDDLLAAAQAELGTTTKRDTVNRALEFVARRSERVSTVMDEVYEFGVGPDITEPAVMRGARR